MAEKTLGIRNVSGTHVPVFTDEPPHKRRGARGGRRGRRKVSANGCAVPKGSKSKNTSWFFVYYGFLAKNSIPDELSLGWMKEIIMFERKASMSGAVKKLSMVLMAKLRWLVPSQNCIGCVGKSFSVVFAVLQSKGISIQM